MLADVPAVLGSLDIVFGGSGSMVLKKYMMITKEFKFSNENLKIAEGSKKIS